ncbi:MAG: TIGR03943 family protein [Clostridium sp.]|uniref:TIGR03943 family putative permease subunit n=1 Tax=Clostridium sp. TaxID=1506 RepID=UPI0025B7FF10|nr:TIGR03943 family protein [Clostridium sp.]MCE5219796.1 TIGR03943 family protein [Clostridium sp.]
MKKLNVDIIIKILILLGFSVFYFELIINNEITMYVHPRIVPFIVLGMIAMFIIVLFLIKDIFHNKKKRIKLKNYVIFIIPLIMIFFMQSNSANSEIKVSDINTNSNITSNNTSNKDNNISNNLTSANSTFDIYSGKTENDGQGTIDKKQLDIENNVIQVNTKNFVFSLDEILGNPDKYDGKEIEITGFVYKDKDLKENEFIIGRFMMVCCAADMQIAGMRCEGNNLESYDNDTWIKVKGKIKKDTYEGSVDPVIVVEDLKKDMSPDTSYVYPF